MLCDASSGRSPSSNPKSYQRPSWNEGLFSHSQQCQPAESNPGFHSLALVLLCGVRKLASKSWPLQIACAIASTTIFRGQYISPHLQSLRLVHFLIIFITIADASYIIKPQQIISQSKKGRPAKAEDAMKCVRGTCSQTRFHHVTSVMNSHGCSSMFLLIMVVWIHLGQVKTDLIK